MFSFFHGLNLLPDQVSNFKVDFTGLNYMEESYPFGFSFERYLQFFGIYLNYIKEKGYSISDVYWLTQPCDSKDIENKH